MKEYTHKHTHTHTHTLTNTYLYLYKSISFIIIHNSFKILVDLVVIYILHFDYTFFFLEILEQRIAIIYDITYIISFSICLIRKNRICLSCFRNIQCYLVSKCNLETFHSTCCLAQPFSHLTLCVFCWCLQCFSLFSREEFYFITNSVFYSTLFYISSQSYQPELKNFFPKLHLTPNEQTVLL